MMRVSQLIASLVFLTQLVFSNKFKSDRKTVYLIELTTSGAKTPDYPDISQEMFPKYGVDRLTPNGERMMYTLGSQLRKDYPEIFPDQAVSSEYEVFSSKTSSAQVSARSHMLGLYPSHKYDTINTLNNDTRYPPWVDIQENFEATTTSLPFGIKPIPLKIESDNSDLVFVGNLYRVCPLAGKERVQASSSMFVDLTNSVKSFAHALKQGGFSPKTYFHKDKWLPNHLSIAYDNLHSYYYYTSKLMNGVEPKQYRSLK
jgi:hypothetical protein